VDLNTVEAVSVPTHRDDVWPLGPSDAILAGGTWLFSEPQTGVRRLVDITHLGWQPIDMSADGIELAATCTLAELSRFSTTSGWPAARLLHQCCTALLASAKIWATATVGGNICLSFPAGAMISMATALDGTATVWRADGTEYTVPVAQFVTGEGTNVMASGDVLRSIHLPAAAMQSRTAFRKLAPSALGRSGAVVIGRRDSGTVVMSVTAATVRPYVFRFPGSPSPDDVRAALDGIPDQAWTRDAHGDPDWRQAVTHVLAEQIRAELA
jgi:CO/xanthine dehydrogenase FAD-binding subunit